MATLYEEYCYKCMNCKSGDYEDYCSITGKVVDLETELGCDYYEERIIDI